MIARLLEMPLVNALIIGLMIWALFFRKTKKKPTQNRSEPADKTTIHQNNSNQDSQYSKEDGKYIDYEEIK